MSSTSNFAAKLWPYVTYFLYFEVVILCLALATLVFLALRRVWGKQPFEGDPNYTKEKIAFELTSEIARLRDLRNRIAPNFAADGDAERAPSGLTADPAVATGAASVDMAALEREVAKKFQERIDYLQHKLQEAEEAAKNAATAAGGAPVVVADPAASEELAKEKAALEQEQSTLKAKVDTLEKTLMEYQIFEQDIALVKKYKNENEELRRQLSATPQVTEEDIASLFSAMTVPDKNAAAAAPAPEATFANPPAEPAAETMAAPAVAAPAPEIVIAKEPAPTPAPQETVSFQNAPSDPSIEELLASAAKPPADSNQMLSASDINQAFASAMQPEAPPAEPKPEPGFAVDNVKPEPEVGLATNLNPEDIEAFAETTGDSGSNDDKIMAEFQKILGGEKP